MYWWRPIVAKSKNIKIRKTTTLANYGMERINAWIRTFILCIVLILFKGLNILIILSDFRFMVLKDISTRLKQWLKNNLTQLWRRLHQSDSIHYASTRLGPQLNHVRLFSLWLQSKTQLWMLHWSYQSLSSIESKSLGLSNHRKPMTMNLTQWKKPLCIQNNYKNPNYIKSLT